MSIPGPATLAFALLAAWASVSLSEPADPHVRLVANAEKVKAHLSTSRELYARGQHAYAAIHAAHPVQELWSLLRPPLAQASPELVGTVGALLEKPGREIDARVPTKQYDETLKRVFAALDDAVGRAVPADARGSLALRANVVLTLLEGVGEEYEEASQDGKIAHIVEYHDAYGFFHRARTLYRSIAGPLRSKAPAATKEIDGALAVLAKGFARVTPPATPLPAEKVREEVREIAAELGKAAGIQGAARRGAAEEIRLVRSLVQQAMDAYEAKQVKRAEELVSQAYLDHFEKVEGPLGQKSRTLMTRLERLIRTDLRGKIKTQAPIADVKQLVTTIMTSLNQAEQLLERR